MTAALDDAIQGWLDAHSADLADTAAPVTPSAGWRAFPLLGGLLRLVGGSVNAVMNMRVVHAILPSLPDHQNPWPVLGCRIGAIEDAVFIVVPDRKATLK